MEGGSQEVSIKYLRDLNGRISQKGSRRPRSFVGHEVCEGMRLMTVYFLRLNSDGPIKIGVTKRSAQKRIESLRSGSPWPINVIGEIDGNNWHENVLHKELSKYRMYGEWFHSDNYVLEVIEKVLNGEFSWPNGNAPNNKSAVLDANSSPLRLYRERKNLTLEQLSKKLGVSSATLSRWESGSRRPYFDKLATIKKLCGIPPSEFRPDLSKIFGGR
jgi:DNA-binding XRE family transcriptional regulator